jgi:ribose 5-phosphate isomerase B
MRVHIGTDHAAFELKEYLVGRLAEAGYEVVDHGATSYDAGDDYPNYIIPTALAVAETGELGIVLGGSGNGEQIAANKVKGIKAILADSVDLARLGREHNHANIVSLGGRFSDLADAWEIVETFLTTPFSQDPRHVRRLALIEKYEADGTI